MDSSVPLPPVTPMAETELETPQAADTTLSYTSSAASSRDASPTRSLRQSIAAARNQPVSNAGTAIRSRKNSHQDLSPSRSSPRTSSYTSTPSQQKTLLTATTPTLPPSSSDPSFKAPHPQKTAPKVLVLEPQREPPRWPISPRLRSPPPILNKPQFAPPRKPEHEPPSISFQRPTPPIMYDQSQSDYEGDDSHSQTGTRTPARGASTTSTLETVQEVSPLASPSLHCIDAALEKLQDSFTSDAGSQVDQPDYLASKGVRALAVLTNESGGENGSLRRHNVASAPPALISRQSSTSNLARSAAKGKPSEGTVKTMTVETETVTSIPQVAVAPAGMQGSNGSLRTKPSSETIRPKKEKKKSSRKQQTVQTSAGEILSPTTGGAATAAGPPRLRHYQSTRFVPGRTEACVLSPTRSMSGQGPPFDDATSPRRSSAPTGARGHSLIPLYQMNSLLTKKPRHSASSKADNFEAKIASAVDEADTSDSEETFVYDSNPPDARDRPHNRFHSRTPSATSMVSQFAADRNGMRSIHSVMESHGSGAGMLPKKKKFSNSYGTNTSNPSGPAGDGNGMLHVNDDDVSVRGSMPSMGSTRIGTATRQPHHHLGAWGRNHSGNGHTYLFDNDSPFMGSRQRMSGGGSNTMLRPSPGPPSPRFGHSSVRSNAGNGKRGQSYGAIGIYDLDDTTTTGAEDERTPLVPSSIRSGRSRRGPRSYHQSSAGGHHTHIPYRQHHPPSLLNRMASCLVLAVMLLLVVSGAIGFMFATTHPLTDVEVVKIGNVIASEQELMFDMTVKAQNPNVVVVVVDSSDLEIFAKSPHAGTDSDWRMHDNGVNANSTVVAPSTRRRDRNKRSRGASSPARATDDPLDDQPRDGSAPNMRLGTILELDQPFSFEGSFFNKGASISTGSLRLKRPGNGTEGGTHRWDRIIEDEFELIIKGVLKYTLPLSQRVLTLAISGRAPVMPNSANDPSTDPKHPE